MVEKGHVERFMWFSRLGCYPSVPACGLNDHCRQSYSPTLPGKQKPAGGRKKRWIVLACGGFHDARAFEKKKDANINYSDRKMSFMVLFLKSDDTQCFSRFLLETLTLSPASPPPPSPLSQLPVLSIIRNWATHWRRGLRLPLFFINLWVPIDDEDNVVNNEQDH